MLLQHLNDFANSRKLLDDLAFRPKAVRWIITLNDAGNLEGRGLVETEGEKRRGKEFDCPQTMGAKNSGGMAEFIADNITAVFGLDTDPEKSMPENTREKRNRNNRCKYDNFWKQIEQACEETDSQALRCLLNFKPKPEQDPSFLRWGVSSEAKPEEDPTWWITKADGQEVRLGPDNFSFRVGGQLLLEDETHIRPFWRKQFEKENKDRTEDAPRGLCLVTGESNRPLALTHNPKVQGVPNTMSGAALVSYEKSAPAFSSYGFRQSLNAPTSIQAATAYCTALNWMLRREDHSIRLGQASCCFWTQNETDATSSWGALLKQADPKAVADFLKSPWGGREREILQREQFHAVTLAGNSGRVAVRHWMQVTLDSAEKNLRRWFRDLQLKPLRPPSGKKKMSPLALFRLACATVREAKDLQPEVTAQLFRAALEGTAPSLTLLHPVLNRLRVDITRDGGMALLNHSRFALAKLILNRNRKDNIMEIPERQNADAGDAAYQCGRLLAVLAEAQAKAHDYKLKGPGVVERYFGTAMTSPASVFPTLLRLNRHHLDKIRKSDKYEGHDRFLDKTIQDVFTKFNCFPRMLNLHAQGRFAIGFYQQKAYDRAAREAAKKINKEK